MGSISTLEKRSTVPFCAANYGNRLDQFQLARASRKGGVGILFPRRESVSLDNIGRLMMALVE